MTCSSLMQPTAHDLASLHEQRSREDPVGRPSLARSRSVTGVLRLPERRIADPAPATGEADKDPKGFGKPLGSGLCLGAGIWLLAADRPIRRESARLCNRRICSRQRTIWRSCASKESRRTRARRTTCALWVPGWFEGTSRAPGQQRSAPTANLNASRRDAPPGRLYTPTAPSTTSPATPSPSPPCAPWSAPTARHGQHDP
jgi:hypothetical protein